MTRKSCTPMRMLAAVLLVSAALAPAVQAGSPGDAGMLSLRFGVGTREAAMGEAGVAASTGAAALYWNPANNLFADFETEVILQHYRYLGLFNQEAAAVAHKTGPGVLGFIFTGFYSDEIQRTSEEPVGVNQGTYKPYDTTFGVSYAVKLGDNFGLGVQVKYLYERIDLYSDSGVAFDFFLNHKAIVDGLVFAASYTNVGGQMNLNQDPFDLPTAFRFGIAWTPRSLEKLTVTGDLFLPQDTNEKANVGAEFRLIPELALRLGTRINYESQGLTAGAGFQIGQVGVDYAYSDMTTDGFDDGHKFALRIVW